MNRESKAISTNQHHACFLGLIVIAIGIFHSSLATAIGSSLSVDRYAHILMVVPVSVVLMYMERRRALAKVSFNLAGGILYLAAVGAFAYIGHRAATMDLSNYISISILLFAICSIAAYLFCYGTAAFKAVAAPLIFLLLMTPMPDWMLEHTITFLQLGSAEVTDWFFTIAGVHFVREGVIISLPEVTIEVAKECSGIRSSLILVISGLVLAHLFLRSPWSKLALTVAIIPMTIFKNALRIFVLTMLGTHVNPSFLNGWLHHQGGIVFFAAAFAAIWGMVWILQRLEGRTKAINDQTASPDAARSF